MINFSSFSKIFLAMSLFLLLTGCSSQDLRFTESNVLSLSKAELEKKVKVDYKNLAPEIKKFTKEKYSEEIGTRPLVLFFYADWCPTCVWIEKNVKKDLKSFPNGTNIHIVDFDKETEVKKKYGVFVQSVLVLLDADGNVVLKLTAPDNEKLIAGIKESL